MANGSRVPVLHQYQSGAGYYVKAHVDGTIVTFQITSEGVRQLDLAGHLRSGQIPLRALGALCQSGHAYTKRGSPHLRPGFHLAEQFEFGFTSDFPLVRAARAAAAHPAAMLA